MKQNQTTQNLKSQRLRKPTYISQTLLEDMQTIALIKKNIKKSQQEKQIKQPIFSFKTDWISCLYPHDKGIQIQLMIQCCVLNQKSTKFQVQKNLQNTQKQNKRNLQEQKIQQEILECNNKQEQIKINDRLQQINKLEKEINYFNVVEIDINDSLLEEMQNQLEE